jgi:hypothetical protein
MIALALLSTAAAFDPQTVQPQNAAKTETVFACEFFRNEREAADGWVHQVDLRVVERADGTWTVERANQAIAVATPFPAQFGSVGRSLGLRWKGTKGNENTAYISFSDAALPNGMKYFWLSFDRPSLWKAPGYGCQSEGDKAAGAGA